jgi:biopolymer transport protein ExbD
MRFSQTEKPVMSINIAPLVDMVFLLIIFILLSSTFILQPGIKVKLPSARAGELQPKLPLVVTMTYDGEIYLNDVQVTLRDFPEVLSRQLAGVQDKTLVIKADKDVHHGMVVQIMDMAKRVGVDKLAVATIPEETLGP